MLYNFLLSTFITLSISLPDIILGHRLKLISARLNTAAIIFIYIFSLLITFIAQKYIFLSFFIFIFFLQLIQVNNWLYFGLPVDPNNIGKIIKEIGEIFSSGIGAADRLWKGWVILSINFILFSTAYFFLDMVYRYTFQLAYVIPLSIILIFPILIFFQGTKIHRASPNRSTFHHSLLAFALWLNYNFIKDSKIKKYKEYSKNNFNEQSKNNHIVLIMGESIASRYCSLYDYNEETTPFLNSLRKSNSFAFSKGISASISTIISFMYFFNLVRETSNLSILKSRNLNIFKIAKEAGYKTYCITAQEEGLFSEAGIEYIDNMVVVKNDDLLLDSYEKIPSTEKTLIVLNIRNIHSPYSKFHKFTPSFNIKDPLVHSYCRALLYHDDWCKQVINLTLKKYKNDFILTFTSDHGELLGENGFFGHTILNELVADVPIWSFCNDENHPFLNWIKNTTYISHYELGCKIAELMGARIINPNEEEDVYYIHGTNILRPSNIEYIKNKDYITYKHMSGNDFESNFTILKVKLRRFFNMNNR